MRFEEIINLYNRIFYKSLYGEKLSSLEEKFLNAYLSLYFCGIELKRLDIEKAKEFKKKLEGS